MGFKLVRVDAVEPCKVSLTLGSHVIGRGKFLDCNDHRVSRKHAELIVTGDSILLKSLHQNPCFYKRSISTDTIIFSQPDSQVLNNGDQFGLIPDSHWYEVIQCLDDSPLKQQDIEDKEEATVNEDSCTEPYVQTESNMEKIFDSIMNEDSQPLLPPSSHPKDTEAESKISTTDHLTTMDTSTNQPVESNDEQNYTMDLQNESTDQQNESTNQNKESTDEQNESTDQQNKSTNAPNSPTVDSTEQSESNKDSDKTDELPVKRQHSEEDTPCDIKKVKLEPETPDKDNTESKEETDSNRPARQTVKKEPGSSEDVRPGPSHDQGSSSNDASTAAPPAPDKQNQPRERCWYGANCYRRNPQHKSTYSHPSDADWGGPQRAACAAGAACHRRDPRHYRDYLHPGDRPGPPGMHFVRRHGNNYYINASVVRFHDDHFELEDSDGDSVDFDYEF